MIHTNVKISLLLGVGCMISRWIEKYRQADKKMQYFILTVIIYSLAIITSTVYSYVQITSMRYHVTDTESEK